MYLSSPMASSIVCSKAVVLLLFIHCLLLLPLFVGAYCYMLVLFCSSFLSFQVLVLSRWGRERELGALVWSEFRVVSVLWIFLVVPWVGLSYVVVAFPGHTHLLVGFPVAPQAKYFYELNIRFYDEQEHSTTWNILFLCMSSFTRPQNNKIYWCFSIVWLAMTLAMPFMEQERIKWCAEYWNLSTIMWATCLHLICRVTVW